MKGEPSHAGEKAARGLGARLHDKIEVRIAMPGNAGEKIDWLDILLRDGVDAVRRGIEAAEAFIPTAEETVTIVERNKRKAEIERIEAEYPLPTVETQRLWYDMTEQNRVMVHRPATKRDRTNATVGDAPGVPISSPFSIRTLLRYVDQNDTYGVRLCFRDPNGQPRDVDIDRANLGKMTGSDIQVALFAAGISTQLDGDKVILQSLKNTIPFQQTLVFSRPGWHSLSDDGPPFFVTPGGMVLGVEPGAVELASSVRLSAASAGTLAGWKVAAAAACEVVRCPHWLLGILAGLAGVLLQLTRLPTCGLNLSGLSTSGKSLAQRLAVSSWSSAKLDGGGLFRSMRSTSNAVEALAQVANGTILALDELAHVDGEHVATLIYSLASGTGKQRLNAEIALRPNHRWATFVVLSGECSLQEKVAMDGERFAPGMAARIANVDVVGIDRNVDSAIIRDIEQIDQHYGHAGPELVRQLIASGMHLKGDALRERVNRAARELAGAGAEGIQIRAAIPFALLLVTGELAVEAELLPAGAPVDEAITWAWRQFSQSSDARALSPEDNAMELLRAAIHERLDITIKTIPASEFDSDRQNNRDAEGFYDKNAIYVTSASVQEWTGGIVSAQQMSRTLVTRDLLAKRKGDNAQIDYVARLGAYRCYALKWSQFGRDNQVSRVEKAFDDVE